MLPLVILRYFYLCQVYELVSWKQVYLWKASSKSPGRLVVCKIDNSRLTHLGEIIWFWWNQAALQQKGFTVSLFPSLLASWTPRQPRQGKCLEFRCCSLWGRITTTRLQKSKNAQLLCRSVPWTQQNKVAWPLSSWGAAMEWDFWVPAQTSQHVCWGAEGLSAE